MLLLLLVGTVQAQTPSTSRPGQVARPTAATPPSGATKNTDPNKGTGVIRGRIMLANGSPARRASIQLVSRGSRATAAGDDGTYEFTDLPADSYRLSAGKPGYLVLEYGQSRAFERGKVIALDDGETLEKIDVTLPASGAISGRIADENGDPVESVVVRLLQLQFMANRRQLVDVAAAGSRTTDDTGRYRIFGVPPGQYVVMASVGSRGADVPLSDDTALPGYAPTYYPGGSELSHAQIVNVDLSQDVAGIDFALAQAPTATLSGFATDLHAICRRACCSIGAGGPVASVNSRCEAGLAQTAPSDSRTFHLGNTCCSPVQSFGPGRGNESEGDFQTMFITMEGREHFWRVHPGRAGFDAIPEARFTRG